MPTLSLPRVVLHMAVSLDGRHDWFTPDIGLFYEHVGRWHEDVTLAGADTMLAAKAELTAAAEDAAAAGDASDHADDAAPTTPAAGDGDQASGADRRPLLVVPDSRGRIDFWPALRAQPYWRDVFVLCSQATPREHLERLDEQGVGYFVAGDDHVDLGAALAHLGKRFGAGTVRVDAGGRLNGALLRAGLVDEISLLVSPVLVGGTSPRSFFRAPDLESADGLIPLRLTGVETLRDDHVWLRYEIAR